MRFARRTPPHRRLARLSSHRAKKWIHFWGFQLSYPRHIEAVWVCVIFDVVFVACLSVICHGGFCRFVLAHVTIRGMLTTPAAICRASIGQIEASTRALSRVNRRRRENWKFPSHFMKTHTTSHRHSERGIFSLKRLDKYRKKKYYTEEEEKLPSHTFFSADSSKTQSTDDSDHKRAKKYIYLLLYRLHKHFFFGITSYLRFALCGRLLLLPASSKPRDYLSIDGIFHGNWLLDVHAEG